MTIIDNIEVIGSSDYIDTEDFCIYAAKNPFWADCQTNEVVCKIKDRNAIAVNLVDAENPKYFQVRIFKYLVRTIYDKVKSGKKVILVCNKGVSRSASIALLYLAITGEIRNTSFKAAKADFLAYYPDYYPGSGIQEFLSKTWNQYFIRK